MEDKFSYDQSVKNLVDQAVKCDDATEAMKFSQAAVNVANAAITMSNIKEKLTN